LSEGEIGLARWVPTNSQLFMPSPELPILPPIVIPWSGNFNDIPTNWHLCDGTQYAKGDLYPDSPAIDIPYMLGQFICQFGVNANYGDWGGAGTVSYLDWLHTHATAAGKFSFDDTGSGHSHMWSGGGFTEGMSPQIYVGGGSPAANADGQHGHWTGGAFGYSVANTDAGTHIHTGLNENPTGTVYPVADHTNEPPYLAKAYICHYTNRARNIPIGGVVFWSGLLADIPTGYHLCDGTGGTQDYQDKFIMCASPGIPVDTSGGALEHDWTHTQVAGSVASGGPGDDSHSYTIDTGTQGFVPDLTPKVGGDAVSFAGAHNHGNVVVETDDSSHTHAITGWQDAAPVSDNLPPYYALALIQRLT
jgi:hypothetical protein